MELSLEQEVAQVQPDELVEKMVAGQLANVILGIPEIKLYLTPMNVRRTRQAFIEILKAQNKGIYLEFRKQGSSVHHASDAVNNYIDQVAADMKADFKSFIEKRGF